jgi:hypothetical protein
MMAEVAMVPIGLRIDAKPRVAIQKELLADLNTGSKNAVAVVVR